MKVGSDVSEIVNWKQKHSNSHCWLSCKQACVRITGAQRGGAPRLACFLLLFILDFSPKRGDILLDVAIEY